MLHYQIEFDDYRQHLIHVTLRFVADPTQVLSLPTWIPGSYLIREFSKHIESVRAYDEEGRLLEIQKFEKLGIMGRIHKIPRFSELYTFYSIIYYNVFRRKFSRKLNY